MGELTVGKSKKKTKILGPGAVTPLEGLKHTLNRTSALAETMLKTMEDEMKTIATTGGKMKAMFGPNGAISSLHKLVQVLDKLGEQVEHIQALTANGKAGQAEPISKEDIRLLEDWLQKK